MINLLPLVFALTVSGEPGSSRISGQIIVSATIVSASEMAMHAEDMGHGITRVAVKAREYHLGPEGANVTETVIVIGPLDEAKLMFALVDHKLEVSHAPEAIVLRASDPAFEALAFR